MDSLNPSPVILVREMFYIKYFSEKNEKFDAIQPSPYVIRKNSWTDVR